MIQDDFQLIRSAKKGDSAAFRQLVSRYDRQVLAIAASYRNNEDDAKDIYQEVFMRVHKGLKNFKFKSSFPTWLYRITANVCISFNAKRKRENHDSIDREVHGTDGSVLFSEILPSPQKADGGVFNEELGKYITRAVDKLPDRQKLAFTLKYYNDHKIREIAEIMECAEGTIKKYLFTAVEKLRADLKPFYEN